MQSAHVLEEIRFVGGFLDGERIRFSEGLNCIIGARGAGKSTILELLRFAMDLVPDKERHKAESERITSLLRKNLTGHVEVTIRTAEGMRFVIHRRHDGDPVVLNEQGEPTDLKVESRALFRPSLYSQNELERIADQSATQLELLDSFEANRIEELKNQLRALHKELEANASALVAIQERLSSDADDLAALPAVAQRLGELKAKAGDSKELDRAHQEQAQRSSEARRMKEALTGLTAFETQVAGMTGMLEREASSLLLGEEASGPNAKVLQEARHDLQELAKTVGAHWEKIVSAVEGQKARLIRRSEALAQQHQVQGLEAQKIIEKHKGLLADSQERSRLEARQGELHEVERKQAQVRQEMEVLLRQRSGMLDRLSELRDQRVSTRRRVAKRINEALSPSVQVRIEHLGGKEAYCEMLKEHLKDQRGRGVNRGDVADKMAVLSPQELVVALRGGKEEILREKAGLSKDQAQKVMARLSAHGAIYALESVELEDKPIIELMDVDQPKVAKDASPGQKCTALLPILLMDSDRPIWIDQPEDNLDGNYICEVIVERMRASKQDRQIICNTHAANIPVLGDAERVFVIASSGAKARVAKAAAIMQCKDEILSLLEGGPEAFRKRKEYYGA